MSIETKRKMQIANEIASQIGNKAFCMMGASIKLATDNGLCFKIGRNAGKVTHIKVELNSLDLYDVSYIRIYGVKYTVLATSENIYADMLLVDFKEKTGMNMSL